MLFSPPLLLALAECDSDSLIFLLIPQDTSFAGSQIGAGGGDGEDAGLLSYEAGGLDTETGDVQCLDVGGGDDGQGNAELSGGGEDAGFVSFQRDGADTFQGERA